MQFPCDCSSLVIGSLKKPFWQNKLGDSREQLPLKNVLEVVLPLITSFAGSREALGAFDELYINL